MNKSPALYFSIDIETDGQSPGLSSMLQLGCAVFEPGVVDPIATFQQNLESLAGAAPDPATMDWWQGFPEIWADLNKNQVYPGLVMERFAEWVVEISKGRRPVACAWPASWDWAFVYYYFNRFGVKSPFGHTALDIKTLWLAYTLKRDGRLGASGRTYKQDVPQEWKGDAKHTHVGIDDAIEQGRILINLLRELA